METHLNEHRRSRSPAPVVPGPAETDRLVRHAVLLQASVGTLGAIEYLKANRIGSAVIVGALTGGAIR